jgi:multicomponent Na+:H+ antiporter subunit D
VLTLATSGRRRACERVGLFATIANALVTIEIARRVLGGGVVLVSQAGGWPAPYGITVAVDALSALLLPAVALVGAAVFVASLSTRPRRLTGGFFHPLFHALMLGVQWSLITGDLFNLFVAFEIMLTASYGLFIQAAEAPRLRFAHQYVLLNLVGSTFFVTAAGLLYGHTGTLNFADLARLARSGAFPPGATPVLATLLLAFVAKAAVFPVWSWLPRTYPTLPPLLATLFGGLLTKVGVYALLRVFVMTLGPVAGKTFGGPLIVAGCVSMLLGGCAAIAGKTIREVLLVGILAQTGYLTAGIGLALSLTTLTGRVEVTAAVVFFLIHNIFCKSALLLCGGEARRLLGSDDLDRTGGLARSRPWLATMFFIVAMSLVGVPPLSGFFGKFLLAREAIEGRYFVAGGIAIGAGVLTLLAMLKLWTSVFWGEPPAAGPTGRPNTATLAAAVLVLATLSMGILAGPWLDACRVAARTLIEPTPYLHAVLGRETP